MAKQKKQTGGMVKMVDTIYVNRGKYAERLMAGSVIAMSDEDKARFVGSYVEATQEEVDAVTVLQSDLTEAAAHALGSAIDASSRDALLETTEGESSEDVSTETPEEVKE